MVAVEFIENGVVEVGELVRRSDDVDAEVGLQEPKGLEGLAELVAGEDPIAVQIKGREALLHALIEQRLVSYKVSYRRSVYNHDSHLSLSLSLSLSASIFLFNSMWMDKDHGILLAVTGHFIYKENQLSWVEKGLKKKNKYQDEIFCFVDRFNYNNGKTDSVQNRRVGRG